MPWVSMDRTAVPLSARRPRDYGSRLEYRLIGTPKKWTRTLHIGVAIFYLYLFKHSTSTFLSPWVIWLNFSNEEHKDR